MKKLFLYFISFFLFFNLAVNSEEITPIKKDFEEIFNVGKMISHDDKFTLYFKTREKAILAKGEEFNYTTIDEQQAKADNECPYNFLDVNNLV